MSEIEKMMQNAGLEKDLYCCDGTCGEPTKRCKDCPNYREIYPQFTAEKQIELIKLIANNKGYPDYEFFGNLFDDYIQFLEFDEALAGLVNSIWILLSEEKKQQIKEILE